MKKLILVVVMILLTGALIFNGCAEPAPAPAPAPTPAPTPAPPEKIELTFATYFPPVSGQAGVWEEYCGEIEKRTNGRVKITYYPGGSLLASPDIAEGVKAGIADIGYMGIGHTPGRFPVLEAICVYSGFPSAFVANHVNDDFYKEFKPKELDAYYVIGVSGNAPFNIWSSKPIYNLEDMKGIKIRAPGRDADRANALGATPVMVPSAEMFDALSKGVIDALFGPFEMAKTFRLAEVCNYVVVSWQIAPVANWITGMNVNTYNNLPADIQTVFDQVSAEYVDKVGQMWNDIEWVGVQYAEEMGVEFIYLTPEEVSRWGGLVKPAMAKEYFDIMTELGFSQEEVQGWFDYMDERADYWLNKQIELGIKSPSGPDEIRP